MALDGARSMMSWTRYNRRKVLGFLNCRNSRPFELSEFLKGLGQVQQKWKIVLWVGEWHKDQGFNVGNKVTENAFLKVGRSETPLVPSKYAYAFWWNYVISVQAGDIYTSNPSILLKRNSNRFKKNRSPLIFIPAHHPKKWPPPSTLPNAPQNSAPKNT